MRSDEPSSKPPEYSPRGRAGDWSALEPLSNDGQRILAGGAIAREVGATRSRHRISYLAHQLGRNVAQLGFRLGNRFWCWLMVLRRRRGLRAPPPRPRAGPPALAAFSLYLVA